MVEAAADSKTSGMPNDYKWMLPIGASPNFGAYPAHTLPSWAAHKDGTLDLINELGTEAIITPAGTLTALPSHSGIVPADITKNLWALGEVAPSLLRLMGGPAGAPRLLANAFGGTDESININNLQMDVNADDSFDPDAFFNEIKQRVAVTRHTR